MLTPALILVLAVLQQPAPQSPASGTVAFDSAKAAIKHVGISIAAVKSGIDVYRRAVFGGTDGDLLTNAEYLRTSCETADTTVRRMAPRVCLHCGSREVQAAFAAYRRMLPSLRAGLERCGARLRQLQRGTEAPKRLRAAVRDVGNPLIVTLRNYESYVTKVRSALNIAAPPQRSRRPAGSAGQ